MSKLLSILPLLLASAVPTALAQDPKLKGATAKIEAKVEQSRLQLSNTHKANDLELLPLKQELEKLELQVTRVRDEYAQTLKIRDSRTLDISNLKAKITAKSAQTEFLANSIDDYFRSFETRLHISESKRLGDEIGRLRGDSEDNNKSPEERLEARLALAAISLDNIETSIGGQRFRGEAVDANGVVGDGTFLLLGPLSYFAGPGESPTHTGLAASSLNSNQPTVTPIPGYADAQAQIGSLVADGEGPLPVDTSGGDAIKIAEATDTVLDQIKKGGAVMYPLLILGGISILIGLLKWLQLSRVKRIGPRRFHQYMAFLINGKADRASEMADKVPGPLGGLLGIAAENADEPKELLEEIMYEKVLHARGRLNSFLPFIKVTAAAAPLLGLLGTVSGMINTFKMITIYGTGDAQTFSGGISEALITTQWGLIVAIPCLLIAAFLSRKAKAVIDDMEKLGLSITNGLPGGNDDDGGTTPPQAPEASDKPGEDPSDEPEGDGDEPLPDAQPQPA